MTPRPVLFVVDDEPVVCAIVKRLAEPAGFDVVACESAAEAIARMSERPADIAFVDLLMPETNGIDLLRQIRDTLPACDVVLMSGRATIESAVEAVKLGARDYLTKPLDFERVTALLKDVRDQAARRQRLLKAESRVAHELEFHGMLGRSAAMQEVFSLIRRLAPHVRSVLITGETGTGKELVAHALHRQGPRRSRRFVIVNCSAVVETLFESELFGHVRGAFTDASRSHTGLFVQAGAGTLFLDEIGEMPLDMQAKLLRALKERQVRPVGADEEQPFACRIVAATNRDLEQEVARKRFREDLFYRINVLTIPVPPLREREGDVIELARCFLSRAAERRHRPPLGISQSAARRLAEYDWPGNVRELEHLIEQLVVLSDKNVISPEDLPVHIRSFISEKKLPHPTLSNGEINLQQAVEQLEDRLIDEALRLTNGNKTAAAQMLGLKRTTLVAKLRRKKNLVFLLSSADRKDAHAS